MSRPSCAGGSEGPAWLCRWPAATGGSRRHRRYLVLSGSEGNSVVVRSCRFAPFYVARGATTRDPNVAVLVETGAPPCQRTIRETMGRAGGEVNLAGCVVVV